MDKMSPRRGRVTFLEHHWGFGFCETVGVKRPDVHSEESMTQRRRIFGRVVFLVAVALGLAFYGFAGAVAVSASQDVDPLVFFAGEDLSVLTVASRRPESAQRAPAIVRVVTARDILTKGYRTLADVLRSEAGFVVRPGERGSTPYLRGVREGILFLYDGVPLRSPMMKSVHPLDEELSLAGVDRVEIVLGPGSVLWGPDAYAGIVNVVPRSMVHGSGAGVRAWAGSQNELGAGWTMQGRQGPVSARLNVHGVRYRSWTDTYLSLQPTGHEFAGMSSHQVTANTVDDAYAWEALGTLTVGDRLAFTGRLADGRHRYTMTNTDGITWAGEKRAPVSFLKGTLRQRLGTSDLSLTASYTHVPLDVTDADVSRKQKDDMVAADLVWYRPWGEGGGVTLGAGYRRDDTHNAVVRDGFLPDLLKPTYYVFVPSVVQADFQNTVLSAYGQVRRRLGPVDLWLGLRLDDTDTYASTTTLSAGAAWSLGRDWQIKATYGTAYRTPYAAQLYGDRFLDPENIETAALELSWTKEADKQVALTVYHSRVSDHLQEDPYGGLSQPSRHAITGAEIKARWAFGPQWDLYGSAAAFDVADDAVHYRVTKAFFVAPDGTRSPIEEAWTSPLDVGPDWSVQLGVRRHFGASSTVALEGLLTGPWPYAYDQGRRTGRFQGERHVRASWTWHHAGTRGATLQLVADNLLDRGGSVPGVFGPAERPPLRVWLEWRLDF
ncbi:TonB-dependent receptor plug domain-containing protein [Desulfosoma caldarium]|uniref:Outer membrane cobalamin receptor n=1 Tax=Desulfosoma caldarium TaxID=610254 RepID=A0A3N1VQ36_9BACT|nr:TonB-dependent receptor [Desulfosoma caldarium]ROR03168.1 outer membrane cobalamin receptor [Desulfosoma caldarium]